MKTTAEKIAAAALKWSAAEAAKKDAKSGPAVDRAEQSMVSA
mgnify:CR=1 FL=1